MSTELLTVNQERRAAQPVETAAVTLLVVGSNPPWPPLDDGPGDRVSEPHRTPVRG